MIVRLLGLFYVLLVGACTDDGPGPAGPRPDAGTSGDAAVIRNGCRVLRDPVAQPGDEIDGDTFQTYAKGFFETYCVRCHSTTNTTPEERNDAPEGRNWDDEASVRMYLEEIRLWVGQYNAMPLDDPKPSCDERRRLVRWIDAEAP
jgi:hypothetical protein